MADKTSIAGPVEIQSASREAVAFKLMDHIAGYESTNDKDARDYWLKLYDQCLQAVNGYDLAQVLKAR